MTYCEDFHTAFGRAITVFSKDIYMSAVDADKKYPDSFIMAVIYLRRKWPGLEFGFAGALIHGVSDIRKQKELAEKQIFESEDSMEDMAY